MSNLNLECDSLPKLQNRIVLCLAKEGPLNVRETSMKLKGSEYTSVNRAFHELLKKGYIKEATVKEYRGRRFPKFWLTEKGLIYAILNMSNLNVLLTRVENIYGKNSAESLLVKLVNILGPKALRLASNLMAQKGLNEQTVSALINMALVNANLFTDKKPEVLVKEALNVLKDYPEFYRLYKQTYRDIKKGILNLSEIVEKEGVEA